MINRVLQTIDENSMFSSGDKVIVAVSGGADSMTLLNILYEIREKLNISIVAAHVNHCLRGSEADEDEEYVKQFCAQKSIEFYSRRVDVHRLAEEKAISCESAGREARYTFFNELKDKFNAQKIALAHNANDQAETMLMHIIRGSGMEGLTGIKPVRDSIYVRPIINIKREEIEQYCVQKGIEYRTDKTNFEDVFARNKIRLQLIPYIKDNFNKDIVSTLTRLSDTIRKDNEYLEVLTEEKYKTYCEINSDKVIICKEAFLEKEAILTRIIRKAIQRIKGDLINFEKIHIYDIINIQKNLTGKKIILPCNLVAYNNYGDISIYPYKENKIIDDVYKLEKNTTNYINNLNIKITIRQVIGNEKLDFKSNAFIKYFDMDKLKNDIILRYRKEGDKFTPLGMNGSKKLKDFFMDLKIPREKRDKVPLICFGDDIAWVVAYQVSEKFKVDNKTKNILEIKIEGKQY